MKTVFLKFSAILLAGLMLLPLLAACDDPFYNSVPEVSTVDPEERPLEGGQKPSSEGGQKPSSKGWQSSLTEEEEGKPIINERFDGEKVRFAVNGEGLNSRSIDIGEGDDPTNTVNVQIMKRNAQVEKELGVDIELSYVGEMQTFFGILQTILASELYVYDVLGLSQYFDLGLSLGDTVGSFYNLADLPEGVTSYLNPETSYWSKSLYETTSYKEVSFFITGDLNLSYLSTLFVSYVNARMWEEYKDEIADLEHSGGYRDPYDIVNNGYWTMDLWMELSRLVYEDTNKNKVQDYLDRTGLMTYDQQLNNIMVDMLIAGSHVTFSTLDGEGTPQAKVNTPKNTAIYHKLYTLLCESDAVTIPWLGTEGNKDENYILDIFAEGNVLLNLNTLSAAEKYLSDMKDDYYVMPLPMFDHAQFDKNSPSLGYASSLLGDDINQYAICQAIGDEKLPCVTATLELMAYYSEKWVTPAYYENVLGDRYGKDPRAAAALELTRAGLYTDFVMVWSCKLDNVNWKWRQHFTEKDKIENNLRSWERNVTGKLKNDLLEQFEPCLCHLLFE
ncbi:MAG: hypothetical protein J6M12_03590 [Clostridia bacterium]|nr:hypothetical protein [Clostridia bacterium]